MSEAKQFAFEAVVAPGTIVPGHLFDERGRDWVDRWAARPVGAGQWRATRRRCQRISVAGVTSRCTLNAWAEV